MFEEYAKEISMNNQEITNEQLRLYPSSKIVNAQVLKDYHQHNKLALTCLEWFEENEPEAVYYYLPKGEYCAEPNKRCNGVRYGLGGDYTSFSHI